LTLSLPTLLALGALSLVPFLLVAATSFAKIVVVLSLLRNALGTPDVPSGAVVTALAIALSAYVMAPVATEMAQRAAPASARIDLDDPLSGASRAGLFEAVGLASKPLADFLLRNAGARERSLFVELGRKARPQDPPAPDGLGVALPAFLITELKEAFQAGLLVLLPFLVIDLLVTNILLALGMSLLSPATVALPFKLLLFVLVDGFYVLSQALVSGYR
jgi:type III secretion protein R